MKRLGAGVLAAAMIMGVAIKSGKVGVTAASVFGVVGLMAAVVGDIAIRRRAAPDQAGSL